MKGGREGIHIHKDEGLASKLGAKEQHTQRRCDINLYSRHHYTTSSIQRNFFFPVFEQADVVYIVYIAPLQEENIHPCSVSEGLGCVNKLFVTLVSYRI